MERAIEMKNILLVCAAGMSTSLLVQRMRKAADSRGLEVNVWAVSASDAKAESQKADVVLLGPQVKYLQKEVASYVGDKPFEGIDMKLYGRMDGDGVLDRALELIG